MTTQIETSDIRSRTALPPLASEGGTKAVTVSAKDRWRHVRLRDGFSIMKCLYRQVTTMASGDWPIGELEQRFRTLTACQHALAMNSGTAALHSALFAVGVGPGDEVIVPSYTWHATASAVLCCGARPVFCDVDPDTLTADPADLAQRITSKTKAIMVVHVWGNPADLEAIKRIADDHQLPLVEDCSHAHGASFKGKPVGSWGAVGCFSLQGGKAVSAGEGGVAVCSERKYYDRMLALGHPVRTQAELKDADFGLGLIHLGPKYRPHLFGVLLAVSGLKRLDSLNALRRRNWAILCEELSSCEGISPTATLPSAERAGFLEFKLLLNPDKLTVAREQFVQEAQAEGVPLTVDRYGALHRIPAFRMGGPLTLDLLSAHKNDTLPLADLPNASSLAERIVTLPAFVDVSEKFVRQCATGLKKVALARSR